MFQHNTFSNIIHEQNTHNTNLIDDAYPGYCKHVLCWSPPEKKALAYLAGDVLTDIPFAYIEAWLHLLKSNTMFPSICTLSPPLIYRMVKSPLHMSLFRVYMRLQQSLNIWFDDAEILTDVARPSHVVFSPHNGKRARKSQLMTENVDYVIILENIKTLDFVCIMTSSNE